MKTPKGIWVRDGECTERLWKKGTSQAIHRHYHSTDWIMERCWHSSLKVLYLLYITQRFYYISLGKKIFLFGFLKTKVISSDVKSINDMSNSFSVALKLRVVINSHLLFSSFPAFTNFSSSCHNCSNSV